MVMGQSWPGFYSRSKPQDFLARVRTIRPFGPLSIDIYVLLSASTLCPVCGLLLFPSSNLSSLPINPAQQQQALALLFLCRHAVHAHCVKGGDTLPRRADETVLNLLRADGNNIGVVTRDTLSSKIA